MEWIYEHNADNSARFVLGTKGHNPLICFGINPSTAVPGALDPTAGRVSKFADVNGYDSWMMVNVYPQIATDPRHLHSDYLPELKAQNESHIRQIIGDRKVTLLAAWGVLIDRRRYLRHLLRDILSMPTVANCDWLSLGVPTGDLHPRHPSRVAAGASLSPFSVSHYL